MLQGDSSWQQKLYAALRKMAERQPLFAMESGKNAQLCNEGQGLGERRTEQWPQTAHSGGDMGGCLPNTSHSPPSPRLSTLTIHHSNLSVPQDILLCLTMDSAYLIGKHSLEWF